MKEKQTANSIEAVRPARRETGAHLVSAERKLLVMRAGNYRFAVFADEVDGVVGARPPAPLPHAPAAVRGVVSVRGRMRTLLDPLVLLAGEEAISPPPPTDDAQSEREAQLLSDAPAPAIVVLQGDEQLALIVESADYLGGFDPESIEQHPDTGSLVRATITLDDKRILILHPSRLFEAAMQGTERRRPR